MTNIRQAAKTDLYQAVTDRIIAALQAGTIPWACPWSRGAAYAAPANLASGRPYRGINVLLLNMQAALHGYEHNRWLTYRQAHELGAQVRRGERGTTVVFFKMLECGDEGEPGAARNISRRKVVPLLRAFTVFNAAQIEGASDVLLPQSAPLVWSPLAAAEDLLRASGAAIHHGGERAFYHPALDLIRLPRPERFADAASYYATALHELTHWSGHESRCNRPMLGRQHIEAYAFEELVAEMGAAFLCGHCGIAAELQHASYLDSWLRALQSDRRLIFTAAAQAQKAADYLLAFAGREDCESAEDVQAQQEEAA